MVNILKKLPPIVVLLMGALAYPAAAFTPTFTLIPINGIISGNPGQVIGWGFTITNSMNYLLVTSSEFDLIPNTQTSIGNYIDFIGSSALVVGPAPDITTETQNFNNMMMKGMGSFTILGNAAPGAMNTGQILLTYDLSLGQPSRSQQLQSGHGSHLQRQYIDRYRSSKCAEYTGAGPYRGWRYCCWPRWGFGAGRERGQALT